MIVAPIRRGVPERKWRLDGARYLAEAAFMETKELCSLFPGRSRRWITMTRRFFILSKRDAYPSLCAQLQLRRESHTIATIATIATIVATVRPRLMVSKGGRSRARGKLIVVPSRLVITPLDESGLLCATARLNHHVIMLEGSFSEKGEEARR